MAGEVQNYEVLVHTMDGIKSDIQVNRDKLKELQTKVNQLSELTVDVRLQTKEIHMIKESIADMKSEIHQLRNRPAALWDKIISAAISAIVTGVIVFLLTRAGLK